MSPPKPSPSFLDRLRQFDPTVLPIVVAVIVLIGAVVWLLGRPLPQPVAGPDPQTAQDVAVLRERQAQLEQLAGRVAALEGIAPRLSALEGRPTPPAPDLAPLREGLAAATGRVEAAERRAQAAEQQAQAAAERAQALAQQVQAATQRAEAAEQRAAALEERVAATARDLAGRPQLDPATLASRAAVEQLANRVEALSRELQAAGAQTQQRLAATEQAIGGFAGRVAANEAALASRAQTFEQQAGRIGQLEQQLAGRIGNVEQQLAGRIRELEGQLTQRGQALEQQAQRLATLEAAAQRLSALEGRSARMAALDAARLRLDAGQPLGPALRPLQDPPPALSRFAEAAPPTESQLRLSFDEAARAALAASEPAREGAGVLDSAVSRLSGLVTVRRGEEVLWGDAAAAEIERARRAVEAGDLQGALRFLSRLSPPAKQAMGDWIAQAEALVAARDALRQMAAG
ncbi:mitofilin family membrane protein [Falsiroseomonas sp.]|uniref:mitofilin family membrane protein n=1 Tax=Falsiroseomonas sp. TaxID=2870721 RepID=UPI00356A26D9